MHKLEFPVACSCNLESYCAACEHKKPMSKSKFYEDMDHGFMDSKLETCCCGQCVDGWHHIALLKDLSGA